MGDLENELISVQRELEILREEMVQLKKQHNITTNDVKFVSFFPG